MHANPNYYIFFLIVTCMQLNSLIRRSSIQINILYNNSLWDFLGKSNGSVECQWKWLLLCWPGQPVRCSRARLLASSSLIPSVRPANCVSQHRVNKQRAAANRSRWTLMMTYCKHQRVSGFSASVNAHIHYRDVQSIAAHDAASQKSQSCCWCLISLW